MADSGCCSAFMGELECSKLNSTSLEGRIGKEPVKFRSDVSVEVIHLEESIFSSNFSVFSCWESIADSRSDVGQIGLDGALESGLLLSLNDSP